MRYYRSVIALLSTLLLATLVGARAEPIGGDFTLIDHNGEAFHLSQLRGKVVLLFFGYTYCPDVCPTELAGIAAVVNALEAAADDVQGLFVSIDPERDRPQVLKEYVHYFSRRLIGLTGAPEQIESVAGQYRVKFKKVPRADGHYTMDHSAQLYLIDRQGRLSAVVPYGLPPEHVLDLVQNLLHSESRQVGARVAQ
jgi:cytochrome oxidase Cu insertion factor (SCO1/SenC/PrrC family)